MGRKKMFASSARAQQELGFRIVPVYPAMRAAIEWFRANGYAPAVSDRPMTRTAIIAAMPGELKPLVRGWPHSTRNGVHFWAQRNEEEEWIAACAGAGQAAATRAFAAIEDGGPIDLVFSVGWAGALTPDIAPGSAHNVAGVIDVRTGERFRCDAGAGDLWLVTSPKVADEAEKRRLASAYNAALVDMEAAAIARLAADARDSVLLHQGRQRRPRRPSCPISTGLSPRRPVSDRPVYSFCASPALVLACAHPDGRK